MPLSATGNVIVAPSAGSRPSTPGPQPAAAEVKPTASNGAAAVTTTAGATPAATSKPTASSSNPSSGETQVKKFTLRECMAAMKQGGALIKYGRNSQPKLRFFNIRDRTTTLSDGRSVQMPHLCWASDAQSSSPSGALPLLHLQAVHTGAASKNFKRNSAGAVVGLRSGEIVKPTQCLSLEFSERSVDVLCQSEEDFELWHQGMSLVVQRNKELAQNVPPSMNTVTGVNR